MNRFVYNSKEFLDEIENSPHHVGEVRFLQSIAKPGMRALDVGGNRGVTAVAMAKQVGNTGRIYAFEPVPEYYAELNENLSRNGVKNVSAHMLALSNRTGRIRFYKHGEGSGITATEDAEMIWVEATTITDFFADQDIDRIDLINLDCEGSELLVFQGAKAILEEQSPQIFCEIHHGYLKDLKQSIKDVIGFLKEIGYEVQPLQMDEQGAETSFEECSHIYAARLGVQNRPKATRKEIGDLNDGMSAGTLSVATIQKPKEFKEERKRTSKNWTRETGD